MISKQAQTAYVEAVLAMKGISAVKYGKTASEMLDVAYFDDDLGRMAVMLNTGMKKRIATKTGSKSAGPVAFCLDSAVERNLMTQEGDGIYSFSPEYFGTKHWKTLNEIRISRIFGKFGSSIRIEARYDDDFEILTESDEVENVDAEPQETKEEPKESTRPTTKKATTS